MGTNTKIEWTDNTINFWWGCVKVANNPCCDNCYAEKHDKRNMTKSPTLHWGNDVPRRAIKSAFSNLAKWQRKAVKENKRVKVFCMSMGDIFEKSMPLEQSSIRPNPLDGKDLKLTTTGEIRDIFFANISNGMYANLDFQMLTKRPSNVTRMVPKSWLTNWPSNVWVGTSVGSQDSADTLIPQLLRVPATIRFLSIEPLVSQIDLAQFDQNLAPSVHLTWLDSINWVIVGGESGHHARPMNPDWVRSIREQCTNARVPFFFKQWGAWIAHEQWLSSGLDLADVPQGAYTNRKPCGADQVYRVGKKNAGRLLDGREWNQMPIQVEMKADQAEGV